MYIYYIYVIYTYMIYTAYYVGIDSRELWTLSISLNKTKYPELYKSAQFVQPLLHNFHQGKQDGSFLNYILKRGFFGTKNTCFLLLAIWKAYLTRGKQFLS